MHTLEVTDCYGEIHTCEIYNFRDFPLDKVFRPLRVVEKGFNKYYNVASAFDIESTSIKRGEENIGFMYHWQWCIGEMVCFGRTWEEFQSFIKRLSIYCTGGIKLPVYVHFLAFEFQFIRDFITITSMFARKKRAPLKVRTPEIEFRCSYFLSNMSLDKFCKKTKGCTFWKKDGSAYNYKKLRTPVTPMTQLEEEYCYCDVRGLCQCIQNMMLEDDMITMPITSTGFVRRDFREAVLSNPDARNRLKNSALSVHQYEMCKQAIRGGNTHCNIAYANELLEGVQSFDLKSSYPAWMLMNQYPVNKFVKVTPNRYEKFERWVHTKACLFTFIAKDIQIIDMFQIPYIDRGHCRKLLGGKFDNGRVLSATQLEMTVTDIDWNIIHSHYTIGQFVITEMYVADYGYLPIEFREHLLEMFRTKCELNYKLDILESQGCEDTEEYADIEYWYMKTKNKINGGYGMMVTDITSPEVVFENEWVEYPVDPESALKAYYKNKNSFLAYQQGMFVPAHARNELQVMLDVVKRDTAYLDTDSVKCINDHKSDFEKRNEEIIERMKKNDLELIVRIEEKEYMIGTWEYEGTYDKFVSVGAKKYCYEKEGKAYVTVSGLAKKKGAEELNNGKGIYDFVIGKVFTDSGRTTHYYNDVGIHELTIDDCTFTNGSNIAVFDTTYKLGITDEYLSLIEETAELR